MSKEYIVYTATNTINAKKYVGVTNNLKRRQKEHKNSPYPFGRAIRKYGFDVFTWETIECESVEVALSLEADMIGLEEVESKEYYNACIGGTWSNVLKDNNPMHDPAVVAKHPNIWSTDNNPMNNPESKAKMIKSQACKKVNVLGKEYYGVREAARSIGVSRQCLVHRLKSSNFPEFFYA